ncbi:hypothetical protein BLD44_014380 [Mastigocladus laminosus UU774]|nr:hypothetical protein BLD44_014380 [Mastigocladus laminosus UU774]
MGSGERGAGKGDRGAGKGDRGKGIRDWGEGRDKKTNFSFSSLPCLPCLIILFPFPQSPIPDPRSPIPFPKIFPKRGVAPHANNAILC